MDQFNEVFRMMVRYIEIQIRNAKLNFLNIMCYHEVRSVMLMFCYQGSVKCRLHCGPEGSLIGSIWSYQNHFLSYWWNSNAAMTQHLEPYS
jgi:hypothetical protein